jgi:hypothetical protein
MRNLSFGGFTPYVRRDPVSGAKQQLLRNPHSNQSSARLKAQQRCVRANLEGHTFRSGDARANASAVRSALAGAARACSRGGGGRIAG